MAEPPKNNANRPSKRDVIVIDDDECQPPIAKNLGEEEPVPSPEVVELQQQVHKLEGKLQRSCRMAGEYLKRAELAESRLDSKYEIRDGVLTATEKRRADELEIRLSEVSSALEVSRRKADDAVTVNSELTREIESLKKEMAGMRRKLQTGTEDRMRVSPRVTGEEEVMILEGPQQDTVVRRARKSQKKFSVARDHWKYSFPDWMREVKRKRFPYVAQIGDHVVYFRQGHELYLNAVESTGLYPIDVEMRPPSDIGMEEFAVVQDIRHILKPYRLVKLKLAKIDSDGETTGNMWTVKYHKMDNVPDFIILKAFYDEGLAMALKVGDKIESAIDGKWWLGTVESIKKNETHPNTHWKSVGVRWESGDADVISVWELRKDTIGRSSGQPVSVVSVTTMASVPYCKGDWPEGDENGVAARRRIKRALLELGECSYSIKVFRSPINLDLHPDYPSKVAYPIDLQTICERIDNKYYRRLRSILQDIRSIAATALAYNKKDAEIVKSAKVLFEAVKGIANDPSIEDVTSYYVSLYDLPEADLNKHKRRRTDEVNTVPVALREGEITGGIKSEGSAPLAGWVRDAIEVLEDLMQRPCSDPIWYQSIDPESETAWETWCDGLRTLCARVRDRYMSNPSELETAVRSLMSTAKNSIDNRRSEIYTDLVALQNRFNSRFQGIIAKFESSQASIKQRVIIDRNKQKRPKARHQHAYNTRRSGVASESDENQPSTSKRRATDH